MTNTKKLMIAAMTGAMVLGAATSANAAFDFDFNFSSSESSSETTTVEDSQGNTYQVTHTVETVDGETTERYENVPVEIYNDTDQEIVGLFMVPSNQDNWGDNLLVNEDGNLVMGAGDHMWGITLNYDPNETSLDIRMFLTEDTYVDFEGLSLTELEDGSHINVEFTENEDGSYHVAAM